MHDWTTPDDLPTPIPAQCGKVGDVLLATLMNSDARTPITQSNKLITEEDLLAFASIVNIGSVYTASEIDLMFVDKLATNKPTSLMNKIATMLDLDDMLVNSLDSIDTSKALSANQGKVLAGYIETTNEAVDSVKESLINVTASLPPAKTIKLVGDVIGEITVAASDPTATVVTTVVGGVCKSPFHNDPYNIPAPSVKLLGTNYYDPDGVLYICTSIVPTYYARDFNCFWLEV